MNETPSAAEAVDPVPKRRFRWRYVFLGLLGAAVLGVLAIVLSLLPGREVQLIRSAVAGAHSGKAETKISFGVGRVALGLARLLTAFTGFDDDAKLVLQSVRQADVSIQILADPLAPGERQAVFEATDRAMTRNGWERIVGVVEGDDQMDDEVIGIYTPSNLKAEDDLRVALFVLEGRDLITVAGRCQLEPLFELASRHGAFRDRGGDDF